MVTSPSWFNKVLMNQPKMRPTRVSYYIYFWSTNYFISEKQVLRSLLAQVAERCTEVKTDLGSNLVLATPKHLSFYRLFVDALFLEFWGNPYWTTIEPYWTKCSTQLNKEPWSRDSWIWLNSTVSISWFVDLAQLISRLLSSQPCCEVLT